MDITGIQNPLKVDLLVKSPQSIVDAWKVGQLVNATAITPQKGGQLTINIGGNVLLAQTQQPITPGQTLQLEVSSLPVMTVLKLVNPTANTGKPDAAPAITISLPPQVNLLNQLAVGQQLLARLPLPIAEQATRTLLELAGNRVAVQLSQPLPANIGQQLKLEVVTPGAIAALKILTPSTPVENIPQALRTTLPQQAPLAPLLTNLAFIAKANTVLPAGPRISPPLPQPVVEMTRAIIDHLPRTDTITTANGIKQAVAQSGLFLEARLAQTLQQSLQQPLPASLQQQAANSPGAQISIDFKGGLLGLLASLLDIIKSMPSANTAPKNAPTLPSSASASSTQTMNLQQTLTELRRHVEGGLARLQLNQLVSSAPEEDGKRGWVTELPVRNGENIDLIQLHIEKDKGRGAKKKTALWTVALSLELKGLGPVQARVSLAGNIINTSFWTENPQATEFIQENLQTLKHRYHEVGLAVGTLNAHKGQAPMPTSADDYLHHTLLDEKA
jgi:hypothetical protein